MAMPQPGCYWTPFVSLVDYCELVVPGTAGNDRSAGRVLSRTEPEITNRRKLPSEVGSLTSRAVLGVPF